MAVRKSKYKNLVFLCGARDFHAMDWYRRSTENLSNINIYILTDLIKGENFKKLITKKDKVFKLIIIDKFLLKKQSKFANHWRHLIKVLVFPFQIYLLKKFSRNYPESIFYAHSMYYIWLAKFAGINFVGRPQGSDLLIKPFKSKIFRFLSVLSIHSAKAIIVDSFSMYESIKKITNSYENVFVIPNGINLKLIQNIKNINKKDINKKEYRKYIVSIRGISELYRIKDILISRASLDSKSIPINFIYPFCDQDYKSSLNELFIPADNDLSSLDKEKMFNILVKTKLVISIPYSDSSPRSVFEAIFCGCIVAITYNPYYETFPKSLRSRVILVDINQENWFHHAINKAEYLIDKPFKPCKRALKAFDQDCSFNEMKKIIFS